MNRHNKHVWCKYLHRLSASYFEIFFIFFLNWIVCPDEGNGRYENLTIYLFVSLVILVLYVYMYIFLYLTLWCDSHIDRFEYIDIKWLSNQGNKYTCETSCYHSFCINKRISVRVITMCWLVYLPHRKDLFCRRFVVDVNSVLYVTDVKLLFRSTVLYEKVNLLSIAQNPSMVKVNRAYSIFIWYLPNLEAMWIRAPAVIAASRKSNWSEIKYHLQTFHIIFK